MVNSKLVLSLFILFFLLTSCNQEEISENNTPPIEALIEEQPIKPQYKPEHSYSGWSCPDNLRGFPAVDIQELDNVPVVIGRLPTKEETQNGISLIYFDSTKTPSAKALDITMPRLARYYSQYTKKNELIIVIQAVEVEQDTVVGFRYLNGGNGSAWFSEVAFLSEEEINSLGSTPFVDQKIEINATKERIWKTITSPTYAMTLGEMFDKDAFIESDWKNNARVHFKYAPNRTVTTGIITALWENTYIQIDYNFEGYHYVEKFLLLDNKETDSVQLQISSGPYTEDYDAQKVVWKNWLLKVKELSEQN